MLCIHCHKHINKLRGSKRHIHNQCLEIYTKEWEDLLNEKAKKEKWERLTCKVKPEYQWMMMYPPQYLSIDFVRDYGRL